LPARGAGAPLGTAGRRPLCYLRSMSLRVRLLELQIGADVRSAGLAAGAALQGGFPGWAALLPHPPLDLAQGLQSSGLRVVRGSLASLVLGGLGELSSAGGALAEALPEGLSRELATELAARAGAIASACAGAGLGDGRPSWTLPRASLPRGRTLVMGIVNVTPDSFSDGGRFLDPERAIEHGLLLAREGADILDVGGESTNPFVSQPVGEVEELRRIEPVVRALSRAAVVSIDTSKARVAASALAAGAEVVNDVSGLARDPALARVCAEHGAAVCLMHMRGTPQDMRARASYQDLHLEVLDELAQAVERALSAGIAEERICLDPGLGFAKEARHNFALVRRQRELAQLGRPLLVGASRKSFIGRASGKEPSHRLHGSVAAAVLAAANGASVVRVHDVAATREALAVVDAVRTSTKEEP
jgi:dihydropteroate synthase